MSGDEVDETGDDPREYTGERVETEDGWVTPAQQNVGPGNQAGQKENSPVADQPAGEAGSDTVADTGGDA